MKRIFKILFILFIASAVIRGFVESFETSEEVEARLSEAQNKVDSIENIQSSPEWIAEMNRKSIEMIAQEEVSIDSPVKVPKQPSRYDQLQIIADSLFQTIPSTSWQARFNEIVTFQDRALAIATKMHPDPNDFMERREAEIVLDERYTKMWAEANFDWYKELDLPDDEKYTILYSVRGKIAGIGVKNGWLDEYDENKRN